MKAELDSKIEQTFPDVCVHKGLASKAGLSGRAVPAFVSDWLVSRYRTKDGVDAEGINSFIARHLPDKKHKDSLLYELRNGNQLKILDSYSVTVHSTTGKLILRIPALDVNGRVSDSIVDENPLLLTGSVWGSGTLAWRSNPDKKGEYEIVMTKYRPMQSSTIDIDYFLRQRTRYSLDEWINLLIRTMGYAEEKYDERKKSLLLTRLIPIVQPRVNLIELAPKGTGKSYVFSQLSRHSWLVSGGIVTRAQLFYDMTRQRPGIISKYDLIILDEIQTIKLANEGEIVGALKGYLESGEYRVMGYHGTAEAGFVILGNIPIEDGMPRDENYFSELPKWLKGIGATALLDRFGGLLPGWELPRIDSSCLCNTYALRADYFGEVLHTLRGRQEYPAYVKDRTETHGDLRDQKAIQKLACGYLKLLYPDLSMVSPEQFEKYCLKPAIELRSNIRRQMSIMDPEYSPKTAEIRVV
ncbi:CHP02688 [Desulfonema limicola]|uniref:CHP02688 n=1 Tax=Desulfonema limicola TaxID=45656 RepID=A0A975B5B9_9BACT|nr:BREX system Lon protease-like protein BrxL [Desulfonema limicola]QTA79053.1 CHP02688 [Desulfonema limicola]